MLKLVGVECSNFAPYNFIEILTERLIEITNVIATRLKI